MTTKERFGWSPGDIQITKQPTIEGVLPLSPFQEPPGGLRLRLNPDKFDRFLNSYQRELVATYDPWLEDIRATIVRGKAEGWAASRIKAMVDAKLQDLESHLIVLGRGKIYEAGILGLGKQLAHRVESPGVLRQIAQLQGRNDQFLAESLIPDLRAMLYGHAEGKLTAESLAEALTKSLTGFRSRVGSYSGGATVAIFETQLRAGVDENRERMAKGERAIPVRWVLDPSAEHCARDPKRGTFGCPDLAKVYHQGWDGLPTVPAGNVSCLANCRCSLEADFGQGWEKI